MKSDGRNRAVKEGGEEKGPLEVFFEAGRDARPQPSARLLAAVLADAAAEAAGRPARGLRPRWPAAAAAMAASVAIGFWLGATGIGILPEHPDLDAGPELEAVTALEPDALGFFALDWEG